MSLSILYDSINRNPKNFKSTQDQVQLFHKASAKEIVIRGYQFTCLEYRLHCEELGHKLGHGLDPGERVIWMLVTDVGDGCWRPNALVTSLRC